MVTQLSKNNNYVMHHESGKCESFDFLSVNTLKTIFIDDGVLEVEVNSSSKPQTIKLVKDQGLVLAPNLKFSVAHFDGSLISVQSEQGDMPIIEIIDHNNKREENEIVDFKKIDRPKKVIKPWGHEIWISWFKHHHVLKRIFMSQGNKCSLQFHEEKSETNYIVSGVADVLKGIFLKDNISEGEALEYYKNINDIDNYITRMGKNDFWDNKPFEIHRVFSKESYTAYEASTAELDDVIRLQDDNNRSSGLIKSEHIT